MNPALSFDEANCVMKASLPDAMDLKTWRGNQQDGTPVVISKFQPSKEDLEELNRGGSIYLYVVGERMPHVSLQTENPFYFLDNPPEIYKQEN